ncbi:hypothetical protein EJB05_17450, partial [Eragrostis curvula]
MVPTATKMTTSSAGDKRELAFVAYGPVARHHQADLVLQDSSSSDASAVVFYLSSPINAKPPKIVLPTVVEDKMKAAAGRKEPACLRGRVLVALKLRVDLPVHFIYEKIVKNSDLKPQQSRFRIPNNGVPVLRKILTPKDLDSANLLHMRASKRRRPRQKPEPNNGAAEEGHGGRKKMKGRVHNGLPVKLVDFIAGAKELQLSRWDSGEVTIIKGTGYLDFIQRCSLKENDVVEIWAFKQHAIHHFGKKMCDESLLHVLIVKKDHQKQCDYSRLYNQHVPGFITQAEQLKAKGVDEILLISVNDPFVMKAWAKTYPENKHVKFLADGVGTYTKALGLELDLSEKGLGIRSRRFALLADNLKVTVANIEEGGQFTISGAEEILKAL